MPEAQLDDPTPAQLRKLTERQLTEVRHKQATIDKLTNQNAALKRMKFPATTEVFQGAHPHQNNAFRSG